MGAQVVKPGALLIASFDRNADYRVDKAEFEAGLKSAYSNADEDGSGVLSIFEYRSWAKKALGSPDAFPAWMNIDRNGNNSVDPDEFTKEYYRFARAYGILDPGGIVLADLSSDLPVRVQERSADRSEQTKLRRSGGRRGKGG